MNYLIGIDLGTSSTKTVLFDEAGNVIASAGKDYPLYTPNNGWAEQKPEDWRDAALETIAKVVKESGVNADDIKGLGISGQMHGLVMLDENGEVIRPSIIWCDQRTEKECEEITEKIGAERLIEITANPALTGFTASKILWVRNNEPENYAKCKHILLPKDYVRYILTGEFATEVSDASGMQLLDVPKRQWSDEVLEKLDIDKSLLAKVYESPEVTGTILPEIAEKTGLSTSTVVVGGAGDNAAAAVGTGVVEDGKAVGLVQDKDSVIFFNFRPDRSREITRAFCDDDFKGFDRVRKDITFVCFSDYDPTIPNKEVAFHKIAITNTFGEWLAAHDMKQARIAETEKYAHVTFFFNGGVEQPNEGEDRILVNSPKDVATYDLKPEMSAPQVCEKLLDAIRSEKYDVIVINFANPDMVGHTGVISAAIKAIETVDECVGKAVQAVKDVDGVLFICADHGNAEQMIDYTTGQPHTAHTTNPVPFILVNYDPAYTLKEGGCLADIVPTLINVMGMERPAEMTGKSLLIKK